MNAKVIIAALVGSVISFFLGWLVFGMLLHPMYAENMVHYPGLMRNETDMRLWGIFLAQVCWASFLAYVFGILANIRTFGKGFGTATIMGILIYAAVNLMGWSTMNMMNSKMMAIDTLASALFMGIIGGVVAMALGWGNKSQS